MEGFSKFLEYLIYGGGSVAAVSFIGERLAWFQALESEKKRFFSFLASTAIGVASYCLLTYAPVSVIEGLTPFFTIVSVSFGIYYVGQIFHSADKIEKPE